MKRKEGLRVRSSATVEESARHTDTQLSTTTTTTTTTTTSVSEAEVKPKVILSRAQRRKLKRPPVVVTAEMKEAARERTRALRKHLRMLKSNGARRRVAKERAKRHRDEDANEEAVHALDTDFRPHKKGRRLE